MASKEAKTVNKSRLDAVRGPFRASLFQPDDSFRGMDLTYRGKQKIVCRQKP
jgi:hypothetical protein